jgi:hypothetical protein
MTSNIARSADAEHDRLRNARQTVVLARTGLSVTQGKATPLLVAQLLARTTRRQQQDIGL